MEECPCNEHVPGRMSPNEVSVCDRSGWNLIHQKVRQIGAPILFGCIWFRYWGWKSGKLKSFRKRGVEFFLITFEKQIPPQRALCWRGSTDLRPSRDRKHWCMLGRCPSKSYSANTFSLCRKIMLSLQQSDTFQSMWTILYSFRSRCYSLGCVSKIKEAKKKT